MKLNLISFLAIFAGIALAESNKSLLDEVEKLDEELMTLTAENLAEGTLVESGLRGVGVSNEAAAWAGACLKGPAVANFDFIQTERYNEWFAEDSVMELAESGIFRGPDEMVEYVDFIRAKFFDFYRRVGDPMYFPISSSQEECVLLVVNINKAQVNAVMGQPKCLETAVAFKLSYTVADTQGNGFQINRVDLFYSQPFLHTLFAHALKGDGMADYICDDVMKVNCSTIWAVNNLDSESCKMRYEALPDTNEEGYLDDKSKGCRILHSAFAEINPKHCPHLSFIPMEDYGGRLWCQESGGVKAEELFSVEELGIIKKVANDQGYGDKMFTECEYVPPSN